MSDIIPTEQLYKNLTVLRVQAYDILANIQFLQNQLRQINEQISFMDQQIKKEKQLLVEKVDK